MTVRLPRHELHCHLDGSVRLETLADLRAATGGANQEPVRSVAVAPPDVGSLHRFLRFIDAPLAALQVADALRRVARELVEDWHEDGVVYGEVRFAPQLHTRRGLALDDVISSVARGLAEGRAATGVSTALLLCCLRHQTVDESLAVVDAALRHQGTVAGVDLAGDERRPGAPHAEAFALAHAGGLPVTIHAGEGAGPESVWEAIDVLGAARIGHGVRSVQDEALLSRLERDRIALEMCPRCNVRTQAVPSMTEHPADRLLTRGLVVTISTDTRTTADTNLDAEFAALQEAFGWGPAEQTEVQEHARAAAFRPAASHAPGDVARSSTEAHRSATPHKDPVKDREAQ